MIIINLHIFFKHSSYFRASLKVLFVKIQTSLCFTEPIKDSVLPKVLGVRPFYMKQGHANFHSIKGKALNLLVYLNFKPHSRSQALVSDQKIQVASNFVSKISVHERHCRFYCGANRPLTAPSTKDI